MKPDHHAILASALLALIVPTAPARAQPAPAVSDFNGRVSRLDALFREASSRGGAYMMLYRVGDRTASRGYGFLDCARTIPMPQDALFDGGSLTKLFTAAAVFKMVETGRLRLDDRLGDLFPGVPAAKRSITVVQLLSHRSGIPNFIGANGRVLANREWSIEGYDYAPLSRAEFLQRIWSAPLDFAPGTGDAYSNSGYNLLAAVVEAASGERYERYVRRSVLLPAGMRNTGYRLLERGRLPLTEQCRDGRSWGDPLSKGVWRGGVSWHLVGAGGMMTTLADLRRFARAIESGPLFRADIRDRFLQSFYGASARCRTSSAALGGSNGMTRSLVLHLPRRGESLITVATHSDARLPEEAAMLAIICPERA